MSERPYARLYLDLVDDDKFRTIVDDDRHFAAWCRLLMIAEGSWPASANLPRSARMGSVRALQAAGLLDIQSGGRYKIHGLDREREMRSDKARASASLRWERSKTEGGKPASRGVRFKVLTRDEFTCRYCGRKAPDVTLDVDHVIPVRDGGSDDLGNLVAACVDCNAGKSATSDITPPTRAVLVPHARARLADARASGRGVLDETRRDETRRERAL